MVGGKWIVGGLVAVALTLGVAWVSQAPYPVEPDDSAVVRLAWRARGEWVEECRTQTPEELAKLPIHMRREEVCEGRVVPFGLGVEIDERLALADTIHGAGARGDRPIYVFREIRIEPGTHALEVRFAPIRAGDGDEAAEPLRRTIRLAPREVALVTYDDDRDELELIVKPRTGVE